MVKSKENLLMLHKFHPNFRSTLLTAEPLWLFYARSTMTNSWLYCDIYFFKHFLKNTKLFLICLFLAHLDQKSMIGILITFRLLSIICKLLIYEFLSNKPKRQMYSSLIGWFTSFWCMFCLEIQQGCESQLWILIGWNSKSLLLRNHIHVLKWSYTLHE